MSTDIIGIGLSTLDHLYLLDDVSTFPAGTLLEFSIQGGGPASTAMAAAARLGASCGMIAAVGDDERGKEILTSLRSCGVDTSHSIIHPGASSCAVLVIVDARTGDRHFFVLQRNFPSIGVDEIDWAYVASARIVHFDTQVIGVEAVLNKARTLGVTISMDAGVQAGLEAAWVPLVDVFIGGADDPAWRERPEDALDAARRIAARGPQSVILTLGAAGCVGLSREGGFHLPAFQVEVVDTTGTGDVFHGAFLYATNRGWPPEASARFASAAAALGATRLGGRAGLATAREVAAFLSSRGQTGPWSSGT